MDFNASLSTANTTAAHKDPSRAAVGSTAFSAALMRALESVVRYRKPVSRDPVACAIFHPATKPKEVPMILALLYLLWSWLPFTYPLIRLIDWITRRDIFKTVDMIGTRTRYIDTNITKAVEQDKIDQVVIMGAGLDARSARLPLGNARVFEIDFAGMLEAKRVMFQQVGFGDCYSTNSASAQKATFVSTDLSESPERWKKDLANSGFDVTKPAVWLLEGVTGYLSRAELNACIEAVYSMSSSRSVFILTWNGVTDKNNPAPWAQNIHLTVTSDPNEFMTPFGWKPVDVTPIGKGIVDAGIKTSPIKKDDNSYWLTTYRK